MSYFLDEENVKEYIEMTREYDGRFLINKLHNYLSKDSSVLELGSGSGRDLNILSENYNVVGSDNSNAFIEIYKRKNNHIEIIYVDATEMDIDRKFDCIYSNKVLNHLKREDFVKSLEKQKDKLNNDGIVFMTLWKGKYREEVLCDGNFRNTYYLEDDIQEIVKDTYDILCMESYMEFDNIEEDSLLVILRKK